MKQNINCRSVCFYFYYLTFTFKSIPLLKMFTCNFTYEINVSRVNSLNSRRKLKSTTVVLRPFSLLTQRLAGGSTQQPPQPLPILRIFPFQPSFSHVPFHHLAPCHPRPSPSSLTFHLERHDLFHPIIIILPQHMSQPP